MKKGEFLQLNSPFFFSPVYSSPNDLNDNEVGISLK